MRQEEVISSTPQPRREQGLTLIELVVAMFIFIIVLAMVVRMLGDSTSAKVSVQEEARSAQSIDQTAEQLASDLRMVVNPNRDSATDKEILAGTGVAGNIKDITLAEPFELHVVANVIPGPSSPAYECVLYRVDANGSLWRAISSDTYGCSTAGASLLDLRRMMVGLNAPKSEASDKGSFARKYVHVPNGTSPSVRFKYLALTTGAVPDMCTVKSYPTLAAPQDLARLVSINLGVFDVRNEAPTVDGIELVYDDTITIRSHTTLSYRMSIKCGGSDAVE